MEPGIQWADDGPFYHGTSVPLHGNRIVPASVHGGHSNFGNVGADVGQASRENTFATNSEKIAWDFAQHSSEQQGGRAYVAQVEPEDPTKIRPGHHAHFSEYVAPSFRVTGRHDIMPGRQGTIPGFDWNEARTDDHWDDANHPDYPADETPIETNPKIPSRVNAFQMDLFTKKTVGHHAAEYAQGIERSRRNAYHRNALRGYYADLNKRR